MNKKKVSVIILTVLTLLILTALIPPAKAQFVLSGWEFPDDYGQGIEGFEIFENSTAAWVQVNGYHPYDETQVHEWNVSVAIKLRCYTWFNSTLTGAADLAEGKNFQRHNVTVTDIADNIVFSQENFTYFFSDDSIDPPMWFYGYEVVLNFLPLNGEIYTVTVTYEVFHI